MGAVIHARPVAADNWWSDTERNSAAAKLLRPVESGDHDFLQLLFIGSVFGNLLVVLNELSAEASCLFTVDERSL